jgi:hypothetical protein
MFAMLAIQLAQYKIGSGRDRHYCCEIVNNLQSSVLIIHAGNAVGVL